MYDDKSWHEGVYIKDKDGNLWAKKEHFYSYKGPDPEYKTKVEYDAAMKKKAEDKTKKLEYKGDPVTGIFWDDVVTYVKKYTTDKRKEDVSMFRKSSSAAASEGYSDDLQRMPNKAGSTPSVTNHKTGEAIDINSNGFLFKTEAMIDLIALQFGLIRDGGAGEAWHFEMTGVKLTKENEKYLKK